MNNINQIKEGLSKLDKTEKRSIILDLLINYSIDYTDISVAYINYLELVDKKQHTIQRLLAGCLAIKYQNIKDLEYNDARSSLLLYPYVPDSFIKDTFKNVSKKAIKKEKEFLEREIGKSNLDLE